MTSAALSLQCYLEKILIDKLIDLLSCIDLILAGGLASLVAECSAVRQLFHRQSISAIRE